jgi:DNA-binding transcriptional LysR family regulator
MSIKVFRQVVESGTFVAAAERLDLSTAMVSKHVMHIEKRLGVRLLNRNTRTLSLTEPGRVYFERCRTILDDLEATELETGSYGAAPRGTLRISCPSWFAGQRLADSLVGFREQYPEIVVDVSFEDRTVDLVEEGYDLALRVAREGSLPAGLIARPVRPMRFFIAGSHDYLKRNPAPTSPEDVARHNFIAANNLESLEFIGPDKTHEIPVRVVLRYRSLAGVANAVAAGIGLGPVPEILLEEPPFANVLTPVLTDYPLQQPTLYAVYVSRKYVPLKIRAFIDFALDRVRQLPSRKSAPQPFAAAK